MEVSEVKKGDLIKFNLSYAEVIYRIKRISRGYVHLEGVTILRVIGPDTNPYKTEARSYDPVHWYFESKAQWLSEEEKALVSNLPRKKCPRCGKFKQLKIS